VNDQSEKEFEKGKDIFKSKAQSKDAQPKPAAVVAAPKILQPYKWRGALPGWKCNAVPNCVEFFTDRDDAILHVIKHFPVKDQEALMQKLIDEKE